MKPDKTPDDSIVEVLADRIEEIGMALDCDLPARNPYRPGTIEHRIWVLRKTVEQLKAQNKRDRKQAKNDISSQRRVIRALRYLRNLTLGHEDQRTTRKA